MQFLYLDFWSLTLYYVNALQKCVDKKDIDYYQMLPWQNAVF